MSLLTHASRLCFASSLLLSVPAMAQPTPQPPAAKAKTAQHITKNRLRQRHTRKIRIPLTAQGWLVDGRAYRVEVKGGKAIVVLGKAQPFKPKMKPKGVPPTKADAKAAAKAPQQTAMARAGQAKQSFKVIGWDGIAAPGAYLVRTKPKAPASGWLLVGQDGLLLMPDAKTPAVDPTRLIASPSAAGLAVKTPPHALLNHRVPVRRRPTKPIYQLIKARRAKEKAAAKLGTKAPKIKPTPKPTP